MPLLLTVASWLICACLAAAMAAGTHKMSIGAAAALGFLLGPIGLVIAAWKCLGTAAGLVAAAVAIVAGVGWVAYMMSPAESVIADSPRIERQIAFDLRQAGAKKPAVDCPEEVEWAPGQTFECSATAARGTDATLTVMMHDDGSYEWALD